MKNKQKFGSYTLEGLDIVEQTVEEALVKEPKKKRRKKAQEKAAVATNPKSCIA